MTQTEYERDYQQGYEAGQEERDALASTVTRQRSEIDMLRAELEAARREAYLANDPYGS